MKKFILMLTVWVVAMISVAFANNVILLQYHPLEYYYTPAGLMLTATVVGVECLILWPASGWYWKKFLDGTIQEEKEES